MDWIERLAKLYNLTVDAVLKALITFTLSVDVRKTQFENFLKSRELNFISLTPSFKEVILQPTLFNLLANYSKEMGETPTQAANNILLAFFKMELELQNGIHTNGKEFQASEENSRNNQVS